MRRQRARREPIPFFREDVPIRLLWYRFPVRQTLPITYHPEIELHFIRRGSVVYTVHDQKHLLRPNSLLVIYPNEIHTFAPDDPEAVVDKITIIFRPAFAGLPAAGRLAGYRDLRHLHLTATGAAAFVRVANDLQAEQDRQPVEWTTLCRLRAQELIVMLKRAADRPVEAASANPAVARVLEWIGRRYAEPYASDELVRATGMSISRLTHLFTAHMGLGIKQYATQLRILKACEMLAAEPELKIESVARAVGFKYAADFNRAFKTRTRLTPAAYRAAQHG